MEERNSDVLERDLFSPRIQTNSHRSANAKADEQIVVGAGRRIFAAIVYRFVTLQLWRPVTTSWRNSRAFPRTTTWGGLRFVESVAGETVVSMFVRIQETVAGGRNSRWNGPSTTLVGRFRFGRTIVMEAEPS